MQLSPGGGLAFRCRACGTTPGYQPFAGASGLSLWIRPNSNSSDPFASSTPNNALPPLKLFVTSETPEGKRYCFNEIYFNTGVFPNGTVSGSGLHQPAGVRGSGGEVHIPYPM